MILWTRPYLSLPEARRTNLLENILYKPMFPYNYRDDKYWRLLYYIDENSMQQQLNPGINYIDGAGPLG